MKFQKESPRDFYVNLGTLFYAIAAADSVVKLEEYTTFIGIIENESSLDETQREIIISSFQNLNNRVASAQDCFKQFVLYNENNEHLFNDVVQHFVLITANKIAASFSNKNKSELILLAKLSITLKKDK